MLKWIIKILNNDNKTAYKYTNYSDFFSNNETVRNEWNKCLFFSLFLSFFEMEKKRKFVFLFILLLKIFLI